MLYDGYLDLGCPQVLLGGTMSGQVTVERALFSGWVEQLLEPLSERALSFRQRRAGSAGVFTAAPESCACCSRFNRAL